MGNCHSHINFNPYIVHHTPFRQLNASVKHFIVSFLLKIQTFFSSLRKGRKERGRGGEGGDWWRKEEKILKVTYYLHGRIYSAKRPERFVWELNKGKACLVQLFYLPLCAWKHSGWETKVLVQFSFSYIIDNVQVNSKFS